MTRFLINRLLRNIARQDSSDWRALLVTSRDSVGEVDTAHSHIAVVSADFAVPSTHREQMVDKYRKVNFGVKLAFERFGGEPDLWLMLVDADDLLSVRLAGFCAQQPKREEHGFYFDRGYRHTPGGLISWRMRDFDRVCGSSSIIALRRGGVGLLSESEAITPHSVVREEMAARNRPLSPLPFPGAVYSVSTGQNHSGPWRNWDSRRNMLRDIALNVVFIGSHMRREFPGIEEPAPLNG